MYLWRYTRVFVWRSEDSWCHAQIYHLLWHWPGPLCEVGLTAQGAPGSIGLWLPSTEISGTVSYVSSGHCTQVLVVRRRAYYQPSHLPQPLLDCSIWGRFSRVDKITLTQLSLKRSWELLWRGTRTSTRRSALCSQYLAPTLQSCWNTLGNLTKGQSRVTPTESSKSGNWTSPIMWRCMNLSGTEGEVGGCHLFIYLFIEQLQ